MHQDAYYTIGSSHAVCQDYALSAVLCDGKRVVALVSDGCSSLEKDSKEIGNPDTDIGARILARAFLKAVARGTAFKDLIPAALKTATDVAKSLMLPEACLSATLCGWLIEDNVAKGFIYGDGALVTKDGAEIVIHHAHRGDSTPEYPRYHLTSESLKHYKGSCPEATQIDIIKTGKIEPIFKDGGYLLEAQLTPGLLLASFSDGIDTLRSPTESLGLTESIEALISTSNPIGEFVQRRLRRQIRDWDKMGFRPSDDLSMAAIAV